MAPRDSISSSLIYAWDHHNPNNETDGDGGGDRERERRKGGLNQHKSDTLRHYVVLNQMMAFLWHCRTSVIWKYRSEIIWVLIMARLHLCLWPSHVSISESPLKSTEFVAISARMQPKDQISTPWPYLRISQDSGYTPDTWYITT